MELFQQRVERFAWREERKSADQFLAELKEMKRNSRAKIIAQFAREENETYINSKSMFIKLMG